MWNRLHGVNLKNVAGNIRNTVSDFATEVAKQAHQLAEEDEEDLLDGEESTPRANKSAVSSHTRRPRRTLSSSPGHEQEEASIAASVRPSHKHALPDAGRLTALRAKMEAEKAKTRKLLTERSADMSSSASEDSPIPFGNRKFAENPKLSTGTPKPANPIAHKSPSRTSSECLEASPAENWEQMGAITDSNQQGIPTSASNPNGLSKPSSASQSQAQEPRKSQAVIRGPDGFEDVPLHSPNTRTHESGHANGAISRPVRVGASGKIAGSKSASPRPHSDTETSQLRNQLSRLKAEMVRSATAQEEEQSRLQEVLAKKDAEIAKLEDTCQRLESLQREHQADGKKESEELHAANKALISLKEELQQAKSRAGKDARRCSALQSQVELLQQRPEGREQLEAELAAQVEEVAVLRAELEAERAAHESTLRDAETALSDLEALKRQAGAESKPVSGVEEQLKQKNIEILNSQAALDEVRRQADTAQSSAREATERLSEKEKSWESERQQLHERLEHSQLQIQSLEGRQKHDVADGGRLRDELKQLKERNRLLQAAEDKATSLEEEVALLSSKLRASQSEALAATAAVKTLEAECRSLEALLDSSQQAKTQEESLQQELKRHAEEAQTREAFLVEELQDSQDRLSQSQADHEKTRALLAGAQAQMQNKSISAGQELAAAREAVEKLEQELLTAESRSQQAEVQISEAEEAAFVARREAQRLAEASEQHSASFKELQKWLEHTAGADAAGKDFMSLTAAIDHHFESVQQELASTRMRLKALQEEASRDAGRDGGVHASASGEIVNLRIALEAAEGERDRAKQQLSRLKQQMVAEQDEEDDKLRWRVDAEVQAAVADAREAIENEQRQAEVELSELRVRLAAEEQRAQGLTADLEAWEAAVAERDTELRNLQGALGELTYESEAAERLRAEIREERRKCQQSRDELRQAEDARTRVELERSAAESQIAAKQRDLEASLEREKRWAEEAAMLRRAVQEGMKRINLINSDSNAMVDRRIVVKLLVTYFQRGQSPELLDLMARMLALTDDDKATIKGSKRGVLRSVAAAPLNLVQGLVRTSSTASGAGNDEGRESLADSWVDFLIQQAQAADASENSHQSPSSKEPSSPKPS